MPARGAIADNETGEIDREKSRRMDGLRQPENHDGPGHHKGRVQPLRQFNPIDHGRNGEPADQVAGRALIKSLASFP